MKRIIIHVDMDAFFASVEQLIHTDWQGHPVIVGADPKGGKGRGVVAAASYEARKFGIHSAMPISKAYKLCPNAIFTSGNMKLYQTYSNKIFSVFYNFTPLVEPVSVDEAFLDMSGTLHLYDSLEDMGKKIKKAVWEETGLTASVGIAPVKSIAKIASDYDKPDGLVVVEDGGVQEFLRDLSVKRLWGVGEKTLQKLHLMGVKTFGDLWEIPLNTLRGTFGKAGIHLYNISRGIDERPVENPNIVKSISNEYTFSEDIGDKVEIERVLLQLCDKVAYRLRKAKKKAQTVTLKLRLEDFETVTRQKKEDIPLQDSAALFKVIRSLFQREYKGTKKIRLIGVGAAGLISEDKGLQLSLFKPANSSDHRVDKVMDMIKEKFGSRTIARAELLHNRKNRIDD